MSEDEVIIEEEVTGYFHALFNGHHGEDLRDTGKPFNLMIVSLIVFSMGLVLFQTVSEMIW